MNEKTKITLLLGGIVLLVIGAVSVSFAFLSITKKQDIANNFTSGCLNVSIVYESNAITLNNTYPITDLEGLGTEGYTFVIENTCSTSTNYQINLESLNKTANTIDTQYIKTSLSSDSMDNLIQNLDSNLVTKAYIENAYVSHNLYKGTIKGNSGKEFKLRIWIDYDTTKEQGANKTYTSKINVIANPDIEVTTEPEIKTILADNRLEGTITGNANTAKYCISNDNKCVPNTNTTITNNIISLEKPKGIPKKELVTTALGNVEVNIGRESIVCISLDDKKTYCFNSFKPIVEPNFWIVATTDEGVYKVSDPLYGGTSYYWRGAVTSNYVKFAGKCWRIVRINGDGSIRLIYDGATCHANGTDTTDNIAVQNVAYNTSYNRSNYVGWTYEGTSQRTLSGTSSNAKTQLESWYASNIENNSTYSSKIADGKYCNDRNVQSESAWTISGSRFNYAGYSRLFTGSAPTLACDSEDVYTLKVGLITADEVEMAGIKWDADNELCYLYNGQDYWTMTPCYWDGTYAIVSLVTAFGYLSGQYVNDTFGLRPVINLKSDVTFTGNGTIDNPYVVL